MRPARYTPIYAAVALQAAGSPRSFDEICDAIHEVASQVDPAATDDWVIEFRNWITDGGSPDSSLSILAETVVRELTRRA
jgi:hypothetical protein